MLRRTPRMVPHLLPPRTQTTQGHLRLLQPLLMLKVVLRRWPSLTVSRRDESEMVHPAVASLIRASVDQQRRLGGSPPVRYYLAYRIEYQQRYALRPANEFFSYINYYIALLGACVFSANMCRGPLSLSLRCGKYMAATTSTNKKSTFCLTRRGLPHAHVLVYTCSSANDTRRHRILQSFILQFRVLTMLFICSL